MSSTTEKRSNSEYMARYRAENKERLAKAAADRYQAKKSEYMAYRREWRRRKKGDPHHDGLVLSQRERYRRKNHERILEASRICAIKHPGRRAASRLKLYAIRKGCFSADQAEGARLKIIELKSPKIGTCFHCGEQFPTRGMHIDHLIPIKKGGLHTAENLVLSCGSCNSSKWAHDPIEWNRRKFIKSRLRTLENTPKSGGIQLLLSMGYDADRKGFEPT